MSCETGPSIIDDGLVLNIDCANIKSNKGRRSILDWDNWTVSSGSVTGYGANGTAPENVRSIQTDPWGNQSIVWGTFPDAVSDADGGWNTVYHTINPDKMYRHSVWVRRISATTAGTFYFGLSTNGTGNTIELPSLATETNPYWNTPGIGALVLNEWTLQVAYIHPRYAPDATAPHSESGLYTIAGGKIGSNGGNMGNNVRFPVDATTMRNRTYHYYSADITSKIEFFQPRIDLCDGSEPAIQDLLDNATNTLTDVSNNGNSGLIQNDLSYDSSNGGSLVFDGVDDHISAGPIDNIGIATTSFSMGGWVYPSGTAGNIISMAATNPSGGWNEPPIRSTGTAFEAHVYPAAYMSYSYTINTWYYLMLVFDYSTTSQLFYVNGELVDSDSGITYSASGLSNYLFFGQTNPGANNTGMFTGKMSNAQVYANKALSAAEVKQNFEAIRSRFGI